MGPPEGEECVKSIARVLRFFRETRNYGYVDRIGNALIPEHVEIALKEALRALDSLYGSAPRDEKGHAYVAVDDRKVVLPRIPSEKEVQCFLGLVREDISYARRAAIYALSFPG